MEPLSLYNNVNYIIYINANYILYINTNYKYGDTTIKEGVIMNEGLMVLIRGVIGFFTLLIFTRDRKSVV